VSFAQNIIKQYLPDETLQAFRTSLGKKVKDPPKVRLSCYPLRRASNKALSDVLDVPCFRSQPRAKKAAAAATPKKTPVKRKKRASTGSTKKVLVYLLPRSLTALAVLAIEPSLMKPLLFLPADAHPTQPTNGPAAKPPTRMPTPPQIPQP
jgi:hypothetical protein